MNNLLEPPWWAPEVLPVPYGTDGKVVLVIRIDAAAAPRPVMYQGYGIRSVFRGPADGHKCISIRSTHRLHTVSIRP